MTHEPYPYQAFTLPDGQRLAYIDAGRGPALLLMHGFAGTATSHFDELIGAWLSRYRVIAPDLRGYGRSQPAPRHLHAGFYAQDARDMVALLDQLGVARVVVLGFSDGGESALLLAARAPERVRAVVAWGVSGVISAAMLEGVETWLPARQWTDERAAWRDEIVRLHGAHQFPALVEGWVAAAQALHARGGDICRDEAAEIRCPALLINGDGETGNLPEDLHRLASRIPAATVRLVRESGHAVHRDQPTTFQRTVEDYLLGVSGDREV